MWLDKLKEMKSKSGLTTREIASMSGIPEPTLEKIFSGATKDPKLTTIQQLVRFFGHTLDDLDNNKKAPPTADKPQGGQFKTLDETNALLEALGYIKHGEDLSDKDLAFLTHLVGLLDAWFTKNKGQ